LFFSCISAPSYKEVDDLVETENFEKARETIEDAQKPKKQENRLYPDRNRLLHEIDMGMISHYDGDYSASSEQLQEGERIIEELFTQSVTLEVASFITNDTVKEYAGEDYEDVYLNLFNSLNYYHRGNLDGALVEIRKMNQKLVWLPDKYSAQNSQLMDYIPLILDDTAFPHQEASAFTDSVFARYLGMLFWRGYGNPDSARIDYEYMEAAHGSFSQVYGNPLPGTASQELDIPAGMARLNILAFAGLSPLKQEKRETYAGIHLFLPELVEARQTEVSSIEIVLEDDRIIRLELLEDIGAVMRETYKSKYRFTFLKTLVRSGIKQAGGDGAAIAARLGSFDSSEEGRLTTETIAFLAKTFMDETESADTRMARYFPQYVYVTGINLEPGTYSFAINYYDSNGSVVHRDTHTNVPVQAGRLNLVESFHLKTSEHIQQFDGRAEAQRERENVMVDALGKMGQRMTLNYTGGYTGGYTPFITHDHSFGAGYEIGTVYFDAGAGFTYINNSYENEKYFFWANMDFGAGFKFYFPSYWTMFGNPSFGNAKYGVGMSAMERTIAYAILTQFSFGYRLRLPLSFSPGPNLHAVNAIEARFGIPVPIPVSVGYRYEFYNKAYHDMISHWEDGLHGVHCFTMGICFPIVFKFPHKAQEKEQVK
jgi:hypothetical protein